MDKEIKERLKEIQESIGRINASSSVENIRKEISYIEKHLDKLLKSTDRSHYRGKIRCFVHKTDKNEYEESDVSVFDDCLISDVDENHLSEILEEEIRNAGLFTFEDSINNILASYNVDDFVEIIADVFMKFTWDDYHQEGDCDAWLENIKSRKLDEYQVERFTKQHE